MFSTSTSARLITKNFRMFAGMSTLLISSTSRSSSSLGMGHFLYPLGAGLPTHAVARTFASLNLGEIIFAPHHTEHPRALLHHFAAHLAITRHAVALHDLA